MSLERLINLARRTGDRLIIQDPISDKHLVILDIDSYEELVDAHMDMFDHVSHDSDFDMYDDEDEQQEHDSENSFEVTASPESLEENFSKFDFPNEEELEDEDDMYSEDVSLSTAGQTVTAPKGWATPADILKKKFNHSATPVQNNQNAELKDSDIVIEELPFDVPFKSQDEIGELNEERLEDSPVFLEEPI